MAHRLWLETGTVEGCDEMPSGAFDLGRPHHMGFPGDAIDVLDCPID
jgi:hypothetical protein